MIGNDSQLAALQQKISDTLKAGNSIAVIGWRNSNHNCFTRFLPDNFVTFLDDSPGALSQNIGFVLFTRFISHSTFKRVKKAKEKECHHPIPLEIGQIKVILESCKDFFKSTSRLSVTVQFTETQTTKPNVGSVTDYGMADGLLDFLTQPQPEIKEMIEIEMEKFAKAFQDPVNQTVEKLVSSKTLGEIRILCGITKTNIQLVSAGWIERVEPTEGKTKAFWYRPGRLMVSDSPPVVTTLPEDPFERAKFLIAKKPTLLVEKEKLTKRQEEIDASLEMIGEAEQMLSKISQFLTPVQPT